MPSHKNVPKFLPLNHEETVAPRLPKYHQNANQSGKRLTDSTSYNLLAIFGQPDFGKPADIKLPTGRVNRLYLYGEVSAELARRNYVVMRNITSERCCEEISAAQFRRDEEFSNRACHLSGSSRSHD